MNLTNLQSLKSLDNLPRLKPLQQNKISTNKKYLNEVELILYSTNLCLFGARILRNEIQVKNRNEVLNIVTDEVEKLYNLLSKRDFLLHSNYTKKDTREFFKKVGLKPKHIEN